MSTDPMLTVEEAQQIVLESTSTLDKERVLLTQALDRILAENIAPRYDIPPHDNSSLDGYAIQAADVQSASQENPTILKRPVAKDRTQKAKENPTASRKTRPTKRMKAKLLPTRVPRAAIPKVKVKVMTVKLAKPKAIANPKEKLARKRSPTNPRS